MEPDERDRMRCDVKHYFALYMGMDSYAVGWRKDPSPKEARSKAYRIGGESFTGVLPERYSTEAEALAAAKRFNYLATSENPLSSHRYQGYHIDFLYPQYRGDVYTALVTRNGRSIFSLSGDSREQLLARARARIDRMHRTEHVTQENPVSGGLAAGLAVLAAAAAATVVYFVTKPALAATPAPIKPSVYVTP